MCFFDCKCKSLKRLGENRKKTKRNIKQTEKLEGKQKKQKYRISSPRTSANKSHKLFAEVRGLEILYFCFLCFPSSFSVFFCFYMCFFDCKCKSLKRLGENRKTTERNITKNIKTRRKTEKTEIQDFQPTNLRE